VYVYTRDLWSVEEGLGHWLYTLAVHNVPRESVVTTPSTVQLGHNRERKDGEEHHHDDMEVEGQVHKRHCSDAGHFDVALRGAVNPGRKIESVMAALGDETLHVQEGTNLEQPGALQDDSHAQHQVHQEQLRSQRQQTCCAHCNLNLLRSKQLRTNAP
jgi:hypothetical protein